MGTGTWELGDSGVAQGIRDQVESALSVYVHMVFLSWCVVVLFLAGVTTAKRWERDMGEFRPRVIDSERLRTEKIGSEMVLLDCEQVRYHVLSDQAARLFALCDGTRTVEALAFDLYRQAGPAEIGAVEAALGTMAQSELIDEQSFPFDRRRLLRGAARAAAGGVIVPLISSVTAADASAHFSRCGDIPSGSACRTYADGTGCTTCCCCAVTAGQDGTCMAHQACIDNYGYLGADCR